MRTVSKEPEPDILVKNKNTWTAEYIADKQNKTKRYRYRHSEIKSILKQNSP